VDFPTPAQATDCNDVDILVCPSTIQKNDILLSAKNIASGNGQSGYGNLLRCMPAESSGSPVESLGSADDRGSDDAPETLVSPSLDEYLRIESGVLVGERYRLIEELPEGNGGRIFLAHDEKPGSAHPARVALKLVHPEIASEYFDFLKDEIEMINGASHLNLLVYRGLERAASRLFIVREWVHGFSLYDLLRIRRSLKPEEVLAVLEPLPATLDLISERGFGLVVVSIRKLFVSCPTDVQPDEFGSLARGDARAWAKCTLKLNPLSLAPLLFRQRRDWSSQTLVPSSRVLSMTEVEAGIRGTNAVRLLGRLVYELIKEVTAVLATFKAAVDLS
jgi:hypothetical protein